MFAALPGAIGRWAMQNTNANAIIAYSRSATLFDAGYTGNPYGNGQGPYYAVLTGAQAISLGATGCR